MLKSISLVKLVWLKTNPTLTWGYDISSIDHKMGQDTCNESKIYMIHGMHMWEGRTKVTFPPQTHIRSFKHLTVHNDDVRINTIGVRPLLISLSLSLIIFWTREIGLYISCWMGGPIPSHRRFRLVQLAHGDGGGDVVPTEGPEKSPKPRLPLLHSVHPSHVAPPLADVDTHQHRRWQYY